MSPHGPRTVEVFADVVCPFTHVGLQRLVARREALGREDPTLRVRAWPLELVNGEPMDADFIAEEVEALRARVAPELFEGFDPERFPTTSMPALALAAAADRADVALGERVSLGLRHALFEEGLDIGDRAVVGRIAARYGLAAVDLDEWRHAVVADWNEGQARGVKGSPHFFVGTAPEGASEEGYFCPSLAISRHDGHLSVEFDEATLQRFMAECFA